MSLVNNIFDNISRIGSDNCDLTNKSIQNTKASNYLLENYSAYSPVTSAFNLAMSQPNVFLNGSPSGGINGNSIDDNSTLKLSQISKPKERVVNQERLFSTVPYLGKGPNNVDVESNMITGDLNNKRKSQDPNSEVSHINYSFYPLLPSIEATINNPANLVEGVAAAGWIRGGVPSRILNREQNGA